MKKTFLAVAAIMMLASCNKSLIEFNQSGEYGYIDLGIESDVEMLVTKAATAMNPTQLAAYNVTLKRGSSVIWTKEYENITEADLKQSAGTYTLYVENLTEEEAAPASEKGAVRVAGTADVTVNAGVVSAVTVPCTAVNSMVTVGNNFGSVFKAATIKITDGTRELPMEWGHEASKGAYYSADTNLSWTLVVTLSDGNQKTYTKTAAATTTAKKWTQINFSTSSTNGNITINITVDGALDPDPITVTETIDPLA